MRNPDLAGLACAAALCALAPPAFAAPAPPTRYTVTENLALVVPGEVFTASRDGERAMSEQSTPPTSGAPKGTRSRAYYDLKAGHSWTLDLIDPTMECGLATFSGDWGDPFVMSAGLIAQLAQYHPTDAGPAVVNGIATEASMATTPDGKVELWVEPKTGLLVKWVSTPPKGPPQTVIEVKSLSLTPLPPTAFVMPPKCLKAG